MFEAEFWVLVSFLIFIGVVLYLRVPSRVGAALDKRATAIARELEEARSIRAEAEQLIASYRGKREQAEKDAAEIVTRAKADAEAMAAEMRKQVEVQIARRTQLAEDNIRRAEAQAVQEVRARAAEIGVAAARDVIRAELGEDQARELLDQGISGVGGRFH